MLAASTKSLSRWFGLEGTLTLEEGSPLDRNFLIVLMCLGIWMLIRRKFSFSGILRRNVWLAVLFAFMLASIAWSPIPFISLKRWIREIVGIVMALVVLTETSPKKAIECVVRRTVYILIPLSLVLIKYYPQHGILYTRWSGIRMWIGVADQKNDLGQLVSLSIFFLAWSLLRRRRNRNHPKIPFLTLADLMVLGIALSLLKGSEAGYSATSMVMLALTLAVYFTLQWLKKKKIIVSRRIMAVSFTAIILYGTVTPLIGRLPLADITSSIGRDSTLTERTVTWEALVPIAMTKPILGHGVGGFWTSDKLGRFTFPAHNGFLEILLVLGFIGILLYSLFLVSSALRAQNLLARDYDWGVLWICWLITALLGSITESALNSFSNFLMAVPLWLAISCQGEDDEP
jgi:O-antigen ligase